MKVANIADIRDVLTVVAAKKAEEPIQLVVIDFAKRARTATAMVIGSCIGFHLLIEGDVIEGFGKKSIIRVNEETGEIGVFGTAENLPEFKVPGVAPAAPRRGRTPDVGVDCSNALPERY